MNESIHPGSASRRPETPEANNSGGRSGNPMVTVGMNYEVLEGKHEAFEKKFALVVEALQATPGHIATHLYQQVVNRGSYLVVSEWVARSDFDAFVSSSEFRKVTSWGAENILAGRPRHQVYGAGGDLAAAKGCPVHAEPSSLRPSGS